MNFPSMPSFSRNALLAILMGVPMAASAQTTSTIASNFNGTAIPATRYILFNAHITSATYSGAASAASKERDAPKCWVFRSNWIQAGVENLPVAGHRDHSRSIAHANNTGSPTETEPILFNH